MNYLERRAQRRLITDLDSRLAQIVAAISKKPRSAERPIANDAGRLAFIALMLTCSAFVAWLLVELLKVLVPRATHSGFYVGLAVASAATLVAFFKELGDLVVEFWSVETPNSTARTHFFIKAFVAFLPLFLATYATNEYLAGDKKSEVNLFLSSTVPAGTAGNDGLFRFNIVFGDPNLDGGEAGWRSLLVPEDVSVAVRNKLHSEFLNVVGRRLNSCGAVAPVNVDVIGYFSSSLWKADSTTDRLITDEDFGEALKNGAVQVLDSKRRPLSISLEVDGRRTRLEDRRSEIQTILDSKIGEKKRASNTAQAFNLWVAEQRASSVCRALLGLAPEDDCDDVHGGAINVVNVSRLSTFDELAGRLDNVETRSKSLTGEPDGPSDDRVLARSAEIIVKSAGSCEIPVNEKP